MDNHWSIAIFGTHFKPHSMSGFQNPDLDSAIS